MLTTKTKRSQCLSPKANNNIWAYENEAFSNKITGISNIFISKGLDESSVACVKKKIFYLSQM